MLSRTNSFQLMATENVLWLVITYDLKGAEAFRTPCAKTGEFGSRIRNVDTLHLGEREMTLTVS
jgi:hypothetical protein